LRVVSRQGFRRLGGARRLVHQAARTTAGF